MKGNRKAYLSTLYVNLTDSDTRFSCLVGNSFSVLLKVGIKTQNLLSKSSGASIDASHGYKLQVFNERNSQPTTTTTSQFADKINSH